MPNRGKGVLIALITATLWTSLPWSVEGQAHDQAQADGGGQEAGGTHHGAPGNDGMTTLPQTVGAPQGVSVRLEDSELRTRHNRRVRFASQVVEDKLIVLSSFYTSCTTVCPVTSAIFSEVQDRLGERLGDDVALVLITVDPTHDTPQRLRVQADKFGAGPGWHWLTGQKQAVDEVLNGLGLYTADYTEHPAAVLIGDGRSGRWSRFYGFPGAGRILAELDRYAQARHQTASDRRVKEGW